jgi:dihydropteroate synthase
LPASLAAARAWTGAQDREPGAWNVLVDRVPEGFEPSAPNRRCWLAGTLGELLARADAARDRFPALAEELAAALRSAEAALDNPPRVLVMGILNVTPDSFSDGGLWTEPAAAVERALEMVEHGADVIDIGGESTRPGAEEVPAAEELRRVLPVLEKLRPLTTAALSIDTRKAEVARACLEAGAGWINDVSGLTHDPALADAAAARAGTKLVLMHSRARPSEERYSTEYDAEGRPVYEDVVADTLRWLRRQAGAAIERGVRPEDLWIDPGFGFGKTFEQNLEILRRLREYASAGLPVLIGTSRKSSVGRLLGDLPPDQRREGTAATVAWSVAQGAAAVRVHDVKEMVRVVRVTEALRSVSS